MARREEHVQILLNSTFDEENSESGGPPLEFGEDADQLESIQGNLNL